MRRVAVFVDAGYLFAQGSAALTGSKKPRTSLDLDCNAVRNALVEFASAKSNGCELLRIYWYDGALASSGLTLEQEALAELLALIDGESGGKVDDLERDRALQPPVARQVDDTHRAAPELALDLVPSNGRHASNLGSGPVASNAGDSEGNLHV